MDSDNPESQERDAGTLPGGTSPGESLGNSTSVESRSDDAYQEQKTILQDIQRSERRVERGESRIQTAIMWTGMAVAVITAIYAFFSYQQWQALRDANATAKRVLNLSERAWRDSRRAFLELAKPDFWGEFKTHAGANYQEPTEWWLMVTNRGIITSPNYLIEKICVESFASEPASVPCAFKPRYNRPLPPMGSPSIPRPKDKPPFESTERIDAQWTVEPTVNTFDDVALGKQNIYIFAVLVYNDGLGGLWRRQGCWVYTKRDEANEVAPGGNHRVVPCQSLDLPETRIR